MQEHKEYQELKQKHNIFRCVSGEPMIFKCEEEQCCIVAAQTFWMIMESVRIVMHLRTSWA
jgi:hypothetical protein